MVERALVFLLKLVFGLRYRLVVRGLENIDKRGDRGLLFLSNHPALIDPPMLMSVLYKRFCPRPLADEGRMDNRWLKLFLDRIRPILIPDVRKSGRAGKDGVREALVTVTDALKSGDNVLLYPSGRIYRGPQEVVGANGAVRMILDDVPDVQVVLVRIKGLWGSRFSWAGGHAPTFGGMGLFILTFIVGFGLFIPKRRVEIEFVEPDDLPLEGGKRVINGYLERFYNEAAPPNTFVPYFFFKGVKGRVMPEPSFTGAGRGEIESIPEETRSLVVDYLREVSGVEEVQPGHLLSTDLGLDSLKLVELMTWIEHEFGVPQEDVEAFNTVGDCFLAAVGELESGGSSELKEVESSWFEGERVGLLEMPAGSNLAELFLAQAAVDPGRVVVADQLSGTKSYRDIITAIIALGPEIGKLEGESVGIMLPATATAAIVYFATLFAGKTPVMVNWTVGAANMRHSLGNAGVANVLTAHALLTKIKKQGLDYSSVGVNLIPLEEIGGRIGLMGKTFAVLRARFSWSPLRQARISETAAVLFTSGSESKPKTVPLTHANFIANMRDYSAQLGLRSDDSMLGMLPPFHSLGLAGNVIMPLCMGLKTVYHANPTEGALLAKLVSAYKTTLLLATPTFLGGILGSARRGELDSLRLVATGAEKCPDHVYGAFDRTCKEAVICEGYGITECSPVVSMNIPDSPVAGTIGKVLQSMEYLLIDTETGAAVDSKGQKGKLLLRGENVFAGYHNHDGKSPFVEYAGKQWYDTGDLVVERADGILAFAGRLKRFVKLAGEMISLPAVEDALAKVFLPGDDSILMAVEATADDKPELVLFTTLDVTRERVNRAITGSGLSPLHSIRRIVRLEEIPILGTGKTDYRSLKAMLK